MTWRQLQTPFKDTFNSLQRSTSPAQSDSKLANSCSKSRLFETLGTEEKEQNL